GCAEPDLERLVRHDEIAVFLAAVSVVLVQYGPHDGHCALRHVPKNRASDQLGREFYVLLLRFFCVHEATRCFSCDLAQAIWRERTHERTSGEGVIGWTALRGGQAPNFSLNL